MSAVSVVVPVLDDADALAVCLDHLARQRVLPGEVVVVDNGSVPTPGLVRQSDLPFPVRVVHEPRRGTSAASARGFDTARGEVLARCDADCRPDAEWVAAVEASFAADPLLDAATGVIAFHDLSGVLGAVGTVFYRVGMGAGMHLALAAPPLWGSNLALRASTWRRVRELVHRHDARVHDDLDLSFALGPLARVRRVPGMRVTAEARVFDSPRHLATRVQRALYTCRRGWRRQPPGHRWVCRLTGGRYLWAKDPRSRTGPHALGAAPSPVFAAWRASRPRAEVTVESAPVAATPAGERVRLTLPRGTRLPVLGERGEAVEVGLPDGSAAWVPAADVQVAPTPSAPPGSSGGAGQNVPHA